jgi:hypothetical protein
LVYPPPPPPAGRPPAPPATGGGVTAEAGGATDGFGPSHPALVGDDLRTLIAPDDNAGTGANSSGNGTLAGTFNPQPGASAEAGGGVARIGGNFSDVGIDDGGGTEVTTILLGNGNGTFSRADGRNR